MCVFLLINLQVLEMSGPSLAWLKLSSGKFLTVIISELKLNISFQNYCKMSVKWNHYKIKEESILTENASLYHNLISETVFILFIKERDLSNQI